MAARANATMHGGPGRGAAKQTRRGPRPSKSKEQFWRGVMRRFARSTGEVRAFCRTEGLSEPSFYAWRSELRRRDATRSNVEPVERSGRRRRVAASRASGNREGRGLQTPGSPHPVFLPVRLAEPGAPTGGRVNDPRVEVLLRSGHVLRLLGPPDRAAWGELIAALEQSRIAATTRSVEPTEGRC